MRTINKILLAGMTAFALLACCRAEVLLNSPFEKSAPTGWLLPEGARVADGALEISAPEIVAHRSARFTLPKRVAGTRLRLSGEFRADNLTRGKSRFGGGKIMLVLHAGAKTHWHNQEIPVGSTGWTKFEKELSVSPEFTSGWLEIGFQDASGLLAVRRLKLEAIGAPLDFRAVANRSLAAWTGQGGGNDGRMFSRGFQRKTLFDIPFELLTQGNAVVLLQSEHFPDGPAQAAVTPPVPVRASYLYILHTLSWAPAAGTTVGEIVVTGAAGREQRIAVQTGRDVADWWMPKRLANGAVALRGKNGTGENVGFYLSRFPLDPALGAVSRVAFVTRGGKPVWILAGATLSEKDHPLPDVQPYTVRPGREWQVYEPALHNMRQAGSALDVSGYLPKEKAGAHGRVVAAPNGGFAFADTPDQPVRFFTCAVQSVIRDRAKVDRLIAELRKNGYNMVRTHFLDNQLMMGAKKDLEFNAERLDIFDYMVFRMKESGIYLNFDAMTSWTGYTPGNCWAAKDKNAMKYSIYFDPAVRENWRKGVEQILTRVNPYTHTRLIDDPVLAMIVGYNEQEFAFVRPFPGEMALREWRDFLRRKYGTWERWRAARGDGASGIGDFSQIPMFDNRSADGDDATLFIRHKEEEMMAFYRDSLRRMGYRGLLTNYNMGKSLHYDRMRTFADFTAINNYHAHPSGTTISQQSSIAGAGRIFRNIMATRPAGKPMIVTEHNHVFWNRYRYEQGFVTGCYAAFQNFGGLTAHAAPVNLTDGLPIVSFRLYADPIALASEFLTFCAFGRGDVAPALNRVRIQVNAGDLEKASVARSSLAEAQTKLALLTGFSVGLTGMATPDAAMQPREIALARSGGARVVTDQAGFASTVGGDTPAGDYVKLLKSRGVLDAANRSNGNNLFVSDTGELTMDTARNFLAVDTPRLQGVCGEAGTTAKLRDFEVLAMSCRGNLALAAVDGMKPIREARRMVLVYATNALNSGMMFESADLSVRLDNGKLPVLLQRGRIRFAVANQNAASLKLYTLAASGARLKRIEPESIADGRAVFALDTANERCGVFFEITSEK